MQFKRKDAPTSEFWQLNEDVLRGESSGKIIWQPRISCWYDDKTFLGQDLPGQYKGADSRELYKRLGVSNRVYDYNACFQKIHDKRVTLTNQTLSPVETLQTMTTPVGTLTQIIRTNTSNPGSFPSKWWITCEEDMKIMTWVEERANWVFDNEKYEQTKLLWGFAGAPCIFMPRITLQSLFIDTMGLDAIYALVDYPATVDRYFTAMNESHERYIAAIAQSPIWIVNFGDNVHSALLPPDLLKKYVMPAYQRRNELLHADGCFTYPHWDGDCKPLLPYLKECGFDGVEAITPLPQGDVTLEETKEALGDLFLLDGVAAVLFEDTFSVDEMLSQTKTCIDLFGPRLVLGISDELPSRGLIERVEAVRDLVDQYNTGKG